MVFYNNIKVKNGFIKKIPFYRHQGEYRDNKIDGQGVMNFVNGDKALKRRSLVYDIMGNHGGIIKLL